MTTEAPVIRTVPAVVTAGDSRAAKAIHGESKVFLEVDGLALVAHVVLVLQQVPEVDSVWVVGNRARLAEVLGDARVQARLTKPLHLIEQRESLLQNAWEGYRCTLSGDPEHGRDPVSEADLDSEILYLSGDLPFATPQEMSAFIQMCRANGAEYTCGLTTEEALAPFRHDRVGGDGIEVAYFNLRDGRFRQNNLHYARPARIGVLQAIEEMYEHRHQQRFINMLGFAWTVLTAKGGGARVVFYYSIMHLSGWLDRKGLRRLADLLRIPTLRMNESAVSAMMQTHFRFAMTAVGGCGIDIDTEEEYAASQAHFERWRSEQAALAAEIYGPPGLPARVEGLPPALGPGAPRVSAAAADRERDEESGEETREESGEETDGDGGEPGEKEVTS